MCLPDSFKNNAFNLLVYKHFTTNENFYFEIISILEATKIEPIILANFINSSDYTLPDLFKEFPAENYYELEITINSEEGIVDLSSAKVTDAGWYLSTK